MFCIFRACTEAAGLLALKRLPQTLKYPPASYLVAGNVSFTLAHQCLDDKANGKTIEYVAVPDFQGSEATQAAVMRLYKGTTE